ncbi:MAG: (2Fe-2S) ferredoxin domain-containing protein [Planctomycetes bacterium]|nr:(2Fe-2S) ferredoxin domain-containing protein [Planctomycetota bacterium]MBL7008232.1 (2Fe-2S) ferredoxin domain-containing protein [Planctomycetota bacterium]
MAHPERIVFVCMNQRPPGAKASCGPAGAGEVLAALRAELEARTELWGRVRVAASSCLGPCEQGPHVVVYPDDVWYAEVKPEDACRILDTVSGDRSQG